MGFFGTFVYSDGRWVDAPLDADYLLVDIHDSDFATVEFRSSQSGTGCFYLGYQPRDYFDAPDDHAPTDVGGEVASFVVWAKRVIDVSIPAEDVRELVAESGVVESLDDFVEETVVRLLHLMHIPPPPDLVVGPE